MFVRLTRLPELHAKVLEKRVHWGQIHYRCLGGFEKHPLDIYLFHDDDVTREDPPSWFLKELNKWHVRTQPEDAAP